MKRLILENDNWIIEEDGKNEVVIISYFEDGHFRDSLVIPLKDIKKSSL